MTTPSNLANIYTVSLNNVGSYQASGMPFCSGSINPNSYGAAGVKIEFPYVTSWIMVMNDDITDDGSPKHFDNPLYVGFSQAGVQGTNHIVVWNPLANPEPKVRTNVLKVKVTELWLSGSCRSASLVAGLTNIPTQQVTNVSPSGSSWSGSVGVG